jgi:gas vesicle protein
MVNKSGIVGFLIGGLVGAIVAMLYSPHSGEENRQIMMNQSLELRDKALQSIQDAQKATLNSLNDAQDRLEELNQEARTLIKKLQEIGQITIEEQRQSLGKGIDRVKDALRPEIAVVENEK